eukprot:351869-Amphidinium_carterae.1
MYSASSSSTGKQWCCQDADKEERNYDTREGNGNGNGIKNKTKRKQTTKQEFMCCRRWECYRSPCKLACKAWPCLFLQQVLVPC